MVAPHIQDGLLALAQAELRWSPQVVPGRKGAPPDPVQDLGHQVREKFVRPAIRATSEAEFLTFVHANWASIVKAMIGLAELRDLLAPPPPLTADAVEDYAQYLARDEEETQEIAFSLRTFARSLRVIRNINAHELPEEHHDGDAAHRQRFAQVAAGMSFALMLLEESKLAWPIAWPRLRHDAMALLRACTAEGFAAVRAALELRRPRPNTPDVDALTLSPEEQTLADEHLEDAEPLLRR